ERFLSLVARLKKQSRARIQAVIAGDGPLREEIERRALELGLPADDVEFLGMVPDMSIVYRRADIFISTSDWEGTPNVALEAMACGLPVVTTRVGGLPEIIQHGDTGYLANAGDQEMMLACLLKLIDNPFLRKKIGGRAREYIVANHSPLALPER